MGIHLLSSAIQTMTEDRGDKRSTDKQFKKNCFWILSTKKRIVAPSQGTIDSNLKHISFIKKNQQNTIMFLIMIVC
jgi:hypothetical protein